MSYFSSWVGPALMSILVACASNPASPPTATKTAAPAASTPPRTDAEPEAESACPKGMAAIPGGTLWLGSPDGSGAADEHPEGKVVVAEYCLHAREVSVADYRACVANKACEALPTEVRLLSPLPAAEHKAQSALCSANLADNSDLPASCVSYEDASRYCAWKGLRLPTEPEWEWAATGGEDKLAWPWGPALPSDENTCWNRRAPCRVGSKKPGAFDVHDLSGGLSEWTSTAYGPYAGTPPDAAKKAVRGGNWESSKEEALRPEKRAAHAATYRDVTVGFRCAKSR